MCAGCICINYQLLINVINYDEGKDKNAALIDIAD